MANYRDNKGRGFSNRNSSDRPTTMFQAVCSNCGKDCEVPFRPTNGKPVMCSRCFENSKGSDRGSSYGNDRGSSYGNDRGNDRRPSYGGDFQRQEFPRTMHDAICEKCGQNCQIPFQPRNGRPVFCNNCFRNSDGGNDTRRPAPERTAPQNNVQLDAINAKLDLILSLLKPAAKKEAKIEKEVAEVLTLVAPEEKEEKKKKVTKKAAVKKSTKKSTE